MYRIADSHCDYPGFKAFNSFSGELYDHGDIEDLKSGGVRLQVFAAWTPHDFSDKLGACMKQLEYMRGLIESSDGKLILCDSAKAFLYDKPIKAVLSIESGETIDCSADSIKGVYGLGIRMLSLTWNFENDFAFGCYCHEGSLKPEGIKAVNELNRLNIALDLSHINEQGFWEAVELYEHIPCASHSCAYDIKPDNRNLKNNQIDYLIKRGGYIGINFFAEFLRGGSIADIGDILKHTEHMLSLGGENCVGFGSDFFGMMYAPQDLNSPAFYQRLPEEMAKRNYSDELISKICYGNFEKYILKFL